MPPDQSDPLVERNQGDDALRAMEALRRFVRALRSANRDLERRLSVSSAQLFVLQQLAEEPGQSLQRLADRTLTASSSVSEVVTRLVAAGFVARTRADDDGRRLVLSLTEAGEQVLARAPRPVQVRLIEGLRKLPTERQREVADALTAWLAAAGMSDVPAEMLFATTAEEDR